MKNKLGLAVLLEQNKVIPIKGGIPNFTGSGGGSAGSSPQPTYTNRYDQLYTIVRGTKLPYEKGQRSPFIGGPKQEIGHSDTSELFDQSFEDNLRNWQRTNGVPETGKLDKETICKMYPRMCENINKSSAGESDPKNTAAKPQSEVLRVLSPYLMRFSKTARPSKDNCKLLIDNYSYQAKNYRKNKESGIEGDVTSQELTPIKKQIMACLNNHPVLKLQLRDMSEMKKSDSPFYLYAEPESSDQAAVNEIPNVLDKPLVISIKEFSTQKPDGENASLSEFRKDKDNKTLLFKINDDYDGKYICGASTFENGGYDGEQVKMTKIGIDTLKKICRKLDYSLGISYYTSNDPDETPQYGKLYEFTKNGNKLNFKFKEQNNQDYYFNCGGGEELIYSQKTKKTIRISSGTSNDLQNKCGFLG